MYQEPDQKMNNIAAYCRRHFMTSISAALIIVFPLGEPKMINRKVQFYQTWMVFHHWNVNFILVDALKCFTCSGQETANCRDLSTRLCSENSDCRADLIVHCKSELFNACVVIDIPDSSRQSTRLLAFFFFALKLFPQSINFYIFSN